jgi:hypothetical protein
VVKSILQPDTKRCYICGNWLTARQTHHVFGAPNRGLSGKYGLTVDVCPRCHRLIHAGMYMDALHKEGQAKFENVFHDESFVKIFGKNYL